ncbi:unnamed protein product [Parascedosporium putredinis]|uniref:RGS domain-containing protein n=1 Tax=Parascedosporium putredinis TaxID=1442378 RepID=A0A9P1HBP4_9PEZI|nr:unnamed protein product [Parascedosporium putredinis]CAI8002262.1 unnamed protein product [Parascedosporium putredinis]
MPLPSWLVWYKKPDYRDIKEYSTAVGTGRRPLSPDGRGKTAIPSRLSLEKVLENTTCSPMSLYDFYMYLKHIEYSPENLEFYIWFKNYEKKCQKAKKSMSIKEKDAQALLSTRVTEIELTHEGSEPVFDPELAQETLGQIELLIGSAAMCTTSGCKPTFGERVKAFAANVTGQNGADSSSSSATEADPDYRGEEQALNKLQLSTDPEHLRPIADHVYLLLRNCSHRNFIRLGVSNGTYETVCVATGLGIVLTIAGFLYMLTRSLAPHIGTHSQWDAFGAWPMWWLGITLILSGLRGSCFFLLLFTRRQPLPWERFDDSASMVSQKSAIVKTLSRLMIFDRKFRVKDASLRQLQHKIVIQSMIGGAVFATIFTLVFLFLPIWKQTI